MNKIYSTLIVFLLISNPSHGSWFDYFFSKTVPSEKIVVRNNISYLINSAKPFTVYVEDIHKNGQISLKGEYKEGKKFGSFLHYYDNGQIKKSSTFFMGIIIF